MHGRGESLPHQRRCVGETLSPQQQKFLGFDFNSYHWYHWHVSRSGIMSLLDNLELSPVSTCPIFWVRELREGEVCKVYDFTKPYRGQE
jgi:hypothetical protein